MIRLYKLEKLNNMDAPEIDFCRLSGRPDSGTYPANLKARYRMDPVWPDTGTGYPSLSITGYRYHKLSVVDR